MSAVKIHYRDEGEGLPLILLHGGWGYGLNPFNRQIEKLREELRTICPDRSGYGRSAHLVGDLPTDFHYRAVSETLTFMDSLGIERASLWEGCSTNKGRDSLQWTKAPPGRRTPGS